MRSEGSALRAICWQELTARINAARDLRQVLSRDQACLTASFADAAAGYFSDVEEGKRAVNPDALGHRKASNCMEVREEGDAGTSDREN